MQPTDQVTPLSPGPTPIQPGSTQSVNKGKYIAIGCGGCAVLAIVGVIVGGWLLMSLGFGVFTDQVKTELRENPVVIEHLGLLEELEVDFMASMSAPGQEEFVFDAVGSKGRGVITAVCVTVDADTEEVVSGTLQLESGEIYDLFPDDPGTESSTEEETTDF